MIAGNRFVLTDRGFHQAGKPLYRHGDGRKDPRNT